MKIKGIIIKGWRSFDTDEGIIINNLKQINVFIGQNNAGKSNIGKYFMFLKKMLKKELGNSGKKIPDDEILWGDINHKLDKNDRWLCNNNNIQSLITLNTIEQENINLKIDHQDKKTEFKLINTKDINGQCCIYSYEFMHTLLFIDPFRHYNKNLNIINEEKYDFDGSEILNLLRIKSNDDETEWINIKRYLNKWLSYLSNENIEFTIEYNPIRLTLNKKDKSISSNLEQLGSGVSQVFMLLSYLILNKEKELNIFIDEPEQNLHPEAVKKLVSIFETEFSNHTFFITTHSTSLIDQVNNNWSIHRVMKKENGATRILPCETIVSQYEILDDLGIRASQLLQTNIIIWVEGPSDKVYIKKWLEDLMKQKGLEYKENIHYSFLIYGGSNLSSHSILSEENDDSINILATSRYAIIVCDSDYNSEQEAIEEKLKVRVSKILERLKLLKEKEIGNASDIKDYVKIIITDGRETENYVPKELFIEILKESPFKKDHIEILNEKKIKEILHLEVDTSLVKEFGKIEPFDNCFAKMYKATNGAEIKDTDRKKIAEKYSNDKLKISKEVINKWEEDNYTKEIREFIEPMIEMIGKANGIK